jgi:hypothetical protein
MESKMRYFQIAGQAALVVLIVYTFLVLMLA